MLNPELLALWYFRLNGFFTIQNFILHPSSRGGARTDADIAGVRFPNRVEFDCSNGLDDKWFEEVSTKPCAVIAEIKTSECAINGPWTRPADKNIQQVLANLGWYPKELIVAAASALYERGFYDGEHLHCSLFCIGNSKSNHVESEYESVPQRTWTDVTHWIHGRFIRYRKLKADHEQWDAAGKTLWDNFERARRNPEMFEDLVRNDFYLPSRS